MTVKVSMIHNFTYVIMSIFPCICCKINIISQLLTNCHGTESSLKTDCRSAGQQIHHFLYNAKIHYGVYISTTAELILSQLNAMHTLKFHLFKINFNIILPVIPTPSILIPVEIVGFIN
jgi:hypothetical protein